MAATYDKLGVRFLYPENWRITDERLESWPITVSVQSPGSGFWSLHVHSTPIEPAKMAAEALRVLREEYDDVEARLVREQIGQTETVGYDMDFSCLDFIITSRARSFRYHGRTYLMICQAEDREFRELEQVFQAITASLLGAGASAAQRD